jgi:DNA modification methylase
LLVCTRSWFELVYQAPYEKRLYWPAGLLEYGIKKALLARRCIPESILANNYECFFYVRKGYPSITRQGRANVFSYKTVPAQRKVHPTERPIELIQDILQTFCWEGARLMVPFAGSGNTLLAASNLGLTAFGYDLSEGI